MTEMIGGVTLDLTKYPGEDLYSEGGAEDVLLDIVKTHETSEYNHQILARSDWSTLYHLSDLRGNIVDFLPIKKSDKVLEVGAGCGAITGTLAKKAGSVTCVELSRKRSLINAHRNKNFDNIEIKVGNFQDVETGLDRDYDYIMLIGVFEYAAAYIKSREPYIEFLDILLSHLKEGGELYIAIENKYGLKYFAGCREDHLGSFFSGIEGYRDADYVRTFSRDAIKAYACDAHCSVYEYYPFPDYKFPVTIYSQDRLPGCGELTGRALNFDNDRALLFDESAAFDEVIKDGLFPLFSNSFLFKLTKGAETDGLIAPRAEKWVVYSKHSCERAAEYAIRTDIVAEGIGKRKVLKYPLTDKAAAHIASLGTKYERLKDGFSDSIFTPNRYEKRGEAAGFEYIREDTLEQEILDLIAGGKEEEALSLIDEYEAALKALSDEEGILHTADLDLIFSNIIRSGGRWQVLDYEWTFDEPVPYRFVLYRALKYSGLEMYYERYGIDGAEIEDYEKKEGDFQRRIAGDRLSLITFDSIFGKEAYPLSELMETMSERGRIERAKLYFDQGEGFSEGNCCYYSGVKTDGNKLTFDITLPKDIKALRIDPSDDKCMIKLLTADVDELLVNGTPLNNTMIFYGEPDPQMIFDLSGHEGESFHIEYRIGFTDRYFVDEISGVIKNEAKRKAGLLHRKAPYEKVRIS